MTPRQTAIVMFLVFGAGCLAGRALGQAPLQVELAELRQAHAETDRLAARSSEQRMQAAQDRGDMLSTQLATAQQLIDQTTKERRDALKTTTFDRPCLGPAAVRVLDGAPGIRVAAVPAPASSAAAADGTTAADTDDAERWISDSAIGAWTLDAGAQYEQCRKRLSALIAWWPADRGPEQ